MPGRSQPQNGGADEGSSSAPAEEVAAAFAYLSSHLSAYVMAWSGVAAYAEEQVRAEFMDRYDAWLCRLAAADSRVAGQFAHVLRHVVAVLEEAGAGTA